MLVSDRVGSLLRATGLVGTLVGCGSMAAMLPGIAASVLGGLGLTGSSLAARALAPVAEPLFILSTLIFLIGALRCGRLATLLAASGSLLLYLSMFQLVAAGNMTNMRDQQANVPTFIAGLALILASLITTTWRRRHHACKPVLQRKPART